MKMQNETTCFACHGCTDDSNFDYCRCCGFTHDLKTEAKKEQKSRLQKAIEKARGGPKPPMQRGFA
jgi:hypothetical protein